MGSARPRGFTLVEVLLVVGLLGLVAFAFISSAADLFRTKDPRVDDIFWQGVTAARQLALEKDRMVILRFDEEKRVLSWALETESSPSGSLPFPGKLEFLPVVSQGSVLLGGQLTETDGMALVRFFPDGACDSFRAQLTDATGRRTVKAIDPWTCAPVLADSAK